MRIRVIPPRQASESATRLTQGIGSRMLEESGTTRVRPPLRLRLEGTSFRPRPTDFIINWGSRKRDFNGWPTLNSIDAVSLAGDKLRCFRRLVETRTPPWTTEREEAQEWSTDLKRVCVRTTLTGHSGEGLSVTEPGVDIPDALLYTMYVPKASEWRVHVFGGEVIDIQRKVRNPDVPTEDVDFQIRTHRNGHIFIRNTEVRCPPDVTDQALSSIRELGLDFGAVDVIWNNHRGEAFVLEVNTAPGLEGDTTLEKYTNAFVERIRNHNG